MAFRTDLAVEAVQNLSHAANLQQVRQSDRTIEGFSVNEVEILTERAAQEIGKPCGRYVTLELDALVRREEDAFPRACRALSTLLGELLPRFARRFRCSLTAAEGMEHWFHTPEQLAVLRQWQVWVTA